MKKNIIIQLFALAFLITFNLVSCGVETLSKENDTSKQRVVDVSKSIIDTLFNDRNRTDRPKRPNRADRIVGVRPVIKDIIEKDEINEIINKIKIGDQKVMKLIGFTNFEIVHDELVLRAVNSGSIGKYYNKVGGKKALPAFVSGFDNEDPYVKLKCIGFLGNWVDEVGINLQVIKDAVDKKLNSNVKLRKEVRWGYKVLKMKIIRRNLIRNLKNGNPKVLQRITLDDFLPIVWFEPQVRKRYLGSSKAVSVRSIMLDTGIDPKTGKLISHRPLRAEGLDIERICYSNVKEVGDFDEAPKWFLNAIRSGFIKRPFPIVSNSAYSIAKEKYTGKLDWNCVKAVYSGMNNKDMLVRAHSALIFLNYTNGWTGDPNYHGKNNNRKVHQELSDMVNDQNYVNLIKTTWNNDKNMTKGAYRGYLKEILGMLGVDS